MFRQLVLGGLVIYFLRELFILHFSTNFWVCSWHCFVGYFTRKGNHSKFLSAKAQFCVFPVFFWGIFFYFLVNFRNFDMKSCNTGLGINLQTITQKVNAANSSLLYITLFLGNHQSFLIRFLSFNCFQINFFVLTFFYDNTKI